MTCHRRRATPPVVDANDVTQPAAKTDPASPILRMPILNVERAKTVLFVKQDVSPGYGSLENESLFKDNTMMLFADAKKRGEEIVKRLRTDL